MKNKLFLIISLIGTFVPHTSILANDGWFEYFVSFIWEAKQNTPQTQSTQTPSAPQPPYQYQPTSFITHTQREQVRRDLESIIDGLFATAEQNRITQMEIQAIKEKTISCIAQRSRNCTTVQELRSATNNNLNSCLSDIIAKNARLLYEQKAARTQGKPAYNPSYLASKVEEDIKAQATVAIQQNIRGILVLFVGTELEQHIISKVQRDFPAPKQAAASVRPAPSAPLHHQSVRENEIYEIYLHPNAARYEQSILKIQQGNAHRAAECCSCLEEFGFDKKRVTLACGHSICPECLYSWIHKNNKKSCPSCRDTIATDEFPAHYLGNYI